MKELNPSDRALVALLPDPIAVQVDRWRQQYDPNCLLVPPHITIGFPPFVPEKEWPSVRPTVADCLRRFAPFTVRLATLGTFDDDPFYLWLRPEDGGILSGIHEALAQLLPTYFRHSPSPYTPHITVGVFVKRNDLLAAQATITDEWVPAEFEVPNLVYMAPSLSLIHI